MAGRRRLRAASNSTVATVDEQQLVYTKETQIIRAASPGLKQEDWPCFLLDEAVVYDKHGQMANLLQVDLQGPFMIRGLLVVEPDQRSCLIRGYQRTQHMWIEISRTYTYSIGLKEESGTPVIWAAGEAAHFELIPAQRYARTASIMFQGIVMHYNVLDVYEAELDALKELEQAKPREKRRKLRIKDVKLELQDIFYRYATAIGDGSTLEEVTERCHDQAGFLLAQFPKDTGFYAWLSNEFPDIVQKLKKKPNPSAEIAFTEPELPASKPASMRQKSSSADSRGSKGKTKIAQTDLSSVSTRAGSKSKLGSFESGSDEQRASRARSVRVKRQSPSKPKRLESIELADVRMRDFAQKPLALPARAKDDPPAAMPVGSASALAVVIDVLNEERQKMLDMWNAGAKHRKHPDSLPVNSWLTKIYMAMSITNYQSKAEVLQYHAGGLARQLAPEWHKSELYRWAKDNANAEPKYEHTTEEHILRIQRRQRNPNTKSSVEKSAPTPIPVPTSGKKPPRGRPSGKAAGLRPSLGGAQKRLREQDGRDDTDFDDEEEPQRKHVRTSEFFASDENEEQLQEDSSSDDEDGDSTDKEPLTRVVIHAEPLPSTTPKGPNHTWSCEEPNCDYVVRSAEDEDGQELIHQHYEEHEKEASDEAKERELKKVNLAMQESRGHLPINHLLDKIRKATSNSKGSDSAELNGRPIPQPIKKALVI
ncbi:hypothetical protein BKA67DRAFT_560151 [Truncatella angustata]|uniref:Uncharacterized protein n=1 Tax=Truncatella angustata TaxID=152316 RepID=A0A9P8UNF9_9PEZI|nr:uncharacterized protein BKA67DRAFT_560151 [Truncatella angustata]KAH6655280.1 hypothetical protein BKA67DRAFT_560151 [Truncatella angustata]